MEKIDLFVILAFREQTYKYIGLLDEMKAQSEAGLKEMRTTLSWHYFMLSKYFNVYNFYEYQDSLSDFPNAVIYHVPFGKGDVQRDVEGHLLKLKGRFPIVMRSYDAHTPLRTSRDYMETYHDFILTYLTTHVDGDSFVFANLSYDNFLVYKQNTVPSNRKFACMVLRRETRSEYHENVEKFKEQNLNLQKIYGIRESIVNYSEIDIYGRNWPADMVNFRGPLNPHIKKYLTINKYKFNFTIENVIVNNYISEKILDSFLALSVPVYLGSPEVDRWIPKSCYVDIRDFDNNDELLSYLKSMPDSEYNQYLESIRDNRDEIFERFSTKNNFAIPVYNWYAEKCNKNIDWSSIDFDEKERDVRELKFVFNIGLMTRMKNFMMNFRPLRIILLRGK
ncbi:glycosyltransferase family 10 [Marinobacter sp. CHS3-4]|uniref:glycosyltransferase family 10 domain-containing protein n=1 Tax=Marinobacter sp. CHS3-4 TaxID=3045174 RepID=UPI0024B59863|nr:glycosyltransferase family 10 [Marinobacter sp. CHS3-4]MDI9244972.1 glycosyltransferase family 10 [Marinobacter sp. CHS3-4]